VTTSQSEISYSGGREFGRGGWRRAIPWFLAAVSGVLNALAYAPFDLDWLVWVALVPLLWALWDLPRGTPVTAGRAFYLGWLAGSVNFLINLFWLTTVTGGGWVLLAAYCGIYTGVFAVFAAAFARWLRGSAAEPPRWTRSRTNLGCAFVCAAAWVALEWARGVLFSGFGWNGLGIALWKNVPMIQFADLAGVGGLSFLIAMTNVMVALTIARFALEIGTGRLRPHYDFAFTIALSALVFTYGVRQLMQPAVETKTLRIASVQAAVPQNEKWAPGFEKKIMERYRLRSEAAIAMDPDLLLWPEAATPRAVFSDRSVWELVHGIAQSWSGDFLLGTVHFDETGDFNSVLLLTQNGRDASLYHKIHLVPFGEFVPFRESFPLFAWIVGELVPEDFDAGKNFTILETVRNPIKIGPLICFEDTLGNLAREFAKRGAQLFVNVTNDGWFERSAGSMQHLSHAVFRCAENKLPMVRSANTGVTCVIDRFGRVVQKLEDEKGDTFSEGVLFANVNVPIYSQATFYTRNGEFFSLVCLATSAAFGVFLVLQNVGRRAKGNPAS